MINRSHRLHITLGYMTILDQNIELGTASCCMSKTENNITQILIQKFSNTISDDLNPKPMKGDKMRINVKSNVEPKKVMAARQVPLRYEIEADKVIADLVQKGVITPVSRTTDWCSPAFFMTKSDTIRMRLVTDYTHLNTSNARCIHSPAPRKYSKPYPAPQHTSPSWTQFMATSSWHSNRIAPSSPHSSCHRESFDTSEHRWD